VSLGLIDIHTHVAPPTLPGAEPTVAGWPCMRCVDNRTMMMLGDKPFRELDARSWDVEPRIADMDADGIDIQLLSPMPELLSYWFSASDAERMADHVNAHIAKMVSLDPRRFSGLGMVPLQDPALAIDYLRHLKTRFGLIGIEIGSNIGGRLPGDPQFDQFFAAAEAYDLAIFVHALHPLATRSVDLGPEFGPVVGFPLDIGMAGASLILSGVLERHPNLRVALSHGGGSIASLVGRLDQGWTNLPGLKSRLRDRPSTQLRRLYFDSNVYDARFLRYLATDMAAGQVCVGTDYPYLIMQADPRAYVGSCGFDSATSASVCRSAALNFLGQAGK
jgi:aminocarboxymuconate-semialdehyde decarboxylase